MTRLPLDGIRVVEFAHIVMGPSCGLVLAINAVVDVLYLAANPRLRAS